MCVEWKIVENNIRDWTPTERSDQSAWKDGKNKKDIGIKEPPEKKLKI